ncbi:hypothetical protein [Mycobacterium sp.]|uniref:hypothetical protein n=1 Tax=Mycobacterium sp. TaxID=1785 RepID=UPI0031E40E6F
MDAGGPPPMPFIAITLDDDARLAMLAEHDELASTNGGFYVDDDNSDVTQLKHQTD